ncbi:hypothetical protein HPB51_011198 [Rhipicephalus microplus]|uniref:Uncharacterized protein n=1 Tax=Rhipicephalus microplus TaxID=6941 RepID=A0A9J6F150_RHIMP|nr:hypothetical protein HPB51_011198 [Rhipicephalus microplus]
MFLSSRLLLRRAEETSGRDDEPRSRTPHHGHTSVGGIRGTAPPEPISSTTPPHPAILSLFTLRGSHSATSARLKVLSRALRPRTDVLDLGRCKHGTARTRAPAAADNGDSNFLSAKRADARAMHWYTGVFGTRSHAEMPSARARDSDRAKRGLHDAHQLAMQPTSPFAMCPLRAGPSCKAAQLPFGGETDMPFQSWPEGSSATTATAVLSQCG